MPSIVGISSNPEKSRRKWEAKVSRLIDWEIVIKYPLREHAKRFGKSYANMFNSNFITEEGDKKSMWYVYRFDYMS